MRRRLPFLSVVASLVVATPIVAGAPVPAAAATGRVAAAATASTQWRAQALANLRLADQAARTKGANPMVWANLARTSGRLNGWQHPTTLGYLHTVRSQRLPSGGWGLGETADAFGDGTVNRADTTYAVTTGEHVGMLLLDGYRAHVVTRAEVERTVDALMRHPRTTLPGGVCLAYSDSPYDRVTPTSRCVHNANAAAGRFLADAARLGVVRPGQRELAYAVLHYDERQQARPGRWPYMTGSPKLQDLDHNSLNAGVHLERRLTGRRQPGGSALAVTMAPGAVREPLDRLAVLNLVPYHRASCATALPLGAQLTRMIPSLPVATAFDHEYLDAVRYSQVALAAARNMQACA